MPDKQTPFFWTWARGVLLIFVTYVFFLIFAQFGFLALIQKQGFSSGDINRVMSAMAAGGLLASVVAALALKRSGPIKLLRIGLIGCAATAFAASKAHSLLSFVLVSFWVGSFVGILTVALASGLRRWLHPKFFGVQAGLGTGLAYFTCNIPSVFLASPEFQANFSAVLCLFGGILISLLPSDPFESDLNMSRAPKADFVGWGFFFVVVSFTALIWFDSAAFYVIQQSSELKASSWNHDAKIWLNGVSHFVFAILAGVAIDRNAYRRLLPLSFVLLGFGLALSKTASGFTVLTGPVYVGGVSLYSTALVAFPSLAGEQADLIPIRWRAALLFGFSGWVGSALGIGMAQDLYRVPPLFVIIAGVAVFLGTRYVAVRS